MRSKGADDRIPHNVSLGRRIKGRRHALSLSQTALANAIGVTFQQVQKYEKGVDAIKTERLVLIAEALITTVSWLLNENREDTIDTFAALDGAFDIANAYIGMPAEVRGIYVKLGELLANVPQA